MQKRGKTALTLVGFAVMLAALLVLMRCMFNWNRISEMQKLKQQLLQPRKKLHSRNRKIRNRMVLHPHVSG